MGMKNRSGEGKKKPTTLPNMHVALAKVNPATAVSERLIGANLQGGQQPLGATSTTLDFLHPGRASSLLTPHNDV